MKNGWGSSATRLRAVRCAGRRLSKADFGRIEVHFEQSMKQQKTKEVKDKVGDFWGTPTPVVGQNRVHRELFFPAV